MDAVGLLVAAAVTQLLAYRIHTASLYRTLVWLLEKRDGSKEGVWKLSECRTPVLPRPSTR
jgi:hypothetical protein